jgi:DNA-binding winged helix-turn-helix (wHTH) protein/Tol biopolymer transport system component
MSQNAIEKVKVNEVEVDFVALKLFVDNAWKNIEARQLNLLKLLVENHGHAVSRNQIMDVLWNDTIVSDNSVSQAITQLRKSLHDDKETPRFIKTVPRVGYQLIADLTFPTIEETEVTAPKNKFTRTLIPIFSALFGVVVTLALFEWVKPNLVVPSYQYESRLTSTPGPESFLRYSPQGRFLAFSQSNNNRSQMDLAVFDSQTQSVHLIKSTGYSEEAAEWSPNGKWLIYYRHDPISCEIRVMSVSNPVETWRLSPDFHLSYCEIGFSRQKMHWLSDETLYIQAWKNNLPILNKLTLKTEGYPSVIHSERIAEIHPLLMDLDKKTHQLLFVEQSQQGYNLQRIDLATLEITSIEKREQEYWGLKWNDSGSNFWLGNESLRLMSLNGDSEIVHLPMGFIPDIDLNPISKQLAHAEGLVNVNLYTLSLKSSDYFQNVRSQQLSSSARTDILPTISKNGKKIAFISYQRRSINGLRHVEIWLKNKDKKTANLLANLPENIHPKYLLWSPNGENLLLGDRLNNIYLINIFGRHMMPIISDYQNIDEVNWSSDGKFITFSATTPNYKHVWQYNLQLKTTELLRKLDTNDIHKEINKNNIALLSNQQIQKINPSYRDFLVLIEHFLITNLNGQLPVENIRPSLMLYRPHVFDLGIYYVVKQGHQLNLYLYQFKQQKNIHIAQIGNHEQDIHLMLNISASSSGKELVFSKVEGFETDILLQKKQEKN